MVANRNCEGRTAPASGDDAEVAQSTNRGAVVAVEVLPLVVLDEVRGAYRLEPSG
jgi:hypothetical protein